MVAGLAGADEAAAEDGAASADRMTPSCWTVARATGDAVWVGTPSMVDSDSLTARPGVLSPPAAAVGVTTALGTSHVDGLGEVLTPL